ncbi:RNA-guided endonuclease TnpB family protein [Streptomyces sp. NPDC047009]|uniref:RNA-guided endonuclease InsQ/TnpB family protein n=1 Tax=Streptomyces sp. NPDC047009 TaxID=3154496 RepID=UPI0033CFF390
MQLRYGFRLYPNGPQQSALARAFGCARVVFNDALRVREDARAAGLPFVTSAELSKQLTSAKRTPQRAWLAEVSSVILQQSLRDLDAAYRNFFDGLKGKRPKTGPPCFKSKRDGRQAIRFAANAGWRITPGGKLRLPKAGDVSVKWSRTLPSTPSTVTVIKDSAGRYFASFVVETEPAEVLPGYGRTLVRIGRFEPTSQVCSACGVKDGPKPLHVRVWECGACQTVLDRDINAAVNVAKAAGLAVTACGAQVRPGLVPAQRDETGTHPNPHPTTARQAGIALL